ncbi:exported protein [Staphylococcus agnetis]|uniref:DUF4889 domain-containing protein n=1 Tax=Staphylococcus agnetis TaxID=985762 RepID=UPI000E02B6A0|nr:DUF4889 domain-containing protein [Staphylococcus agnetis]SUK04783.1 exported protein [Staphylococcus agnetis]
MKKIYFAIPITIILIVIIYLVASMYILNKEEVYYGQVSDDNGLIKTLVSNDNDATKENVKISKEDGLNVQKNDVVKIVYTDNGGVIMEQSKIDKSEVPKNLQKHFK